MITKEQALSTYVGQVLYHTSLRNKDGSALRARVNGKCMVWVRRPDEWQLPVKHGLRERFLIGPDEIGNQNAIHWELTDPTEEEGIRVQRCLMLGLEVDTPAGIVHDVMIDRGLIPQA